MSFWKDKWCETTPLCEYFPSLFALATSKEAWVKNVWFVPDSEEKEVGSWNPRFFRPFNDCELDEV